MPQLPLSIGLLVAVGVDAPHKTNKRLPPRHDVGLTAREKVAKLLSSADRTQGDSAPHETVPLCSCDLSIA